MKGALAVFVKTPELSPVKTRLAASLGKAAAVAVYAECLGLSADMMRELPADVKPFWAVGELAGLKSKRWGEFPVIFTGEGTLGDRLNLVYSTLQKQYGRVALAGSDCPQLKSTAVSCALQQAHGKTIIGPADDGGFYLFAAARRITKKTWTTVKYSQDDTLTQLLRRLDGGRTVFLPPLSDVDDIRSLKAALKLMQKDSSPQQRQSAIRLKNKLWG
ncbi:MAG: DUF2064 domain-containing protein [Candidatus Zeuxoniibacter abyssi]|nr:MAG: DUF2064 domain-containing protein [Candidatus Persebacteraceae bacterium AB1(2)]